MIGRLNIWAGGGQEKSAASNSGLEDVTKDMQRLEKSKAAAIRRAVDSGELPEEYANFYHKGHGTYKGRCGHVVAQCRCMSKNHPVPGLEFTLGIDCPSCQASPVVKVASAKELIEAGACCGSDCDNCPYTPRHQKGATELEKQACYDRSDPGWCPCVEKSASDTDIYRCGCHGNPMIKSKGFLSLEKAAAKMVRKERQVTEVDDHCPHCDYKFREKSYPRPRFPKEASEDERHALFMAGDYDEHCPNCDGIVDREEMGDDEIAKAANGFGGDDMVEILLKQREAIRRRKAMRKQAAEDIPHDEAPGVPPDIQFFTDGKDRATASVGDWHSDKQWDAAVKFGRKRWNNFEEPDDTEIGKPEWATETVNVRPEFESWVGFDFDGTLVQNLDDFETDKYGKTYPEMLRKLKEHLDQGDKVKIFTARAAGDGAGVSGVKKWLKENDLEGLEITNEKDPGMRKFYDDRSAVVFGGKPYDIRGMQLKEAKLRPVDERLRRLYERRGECMHCGEPNVEELNRCKCTGKSAKLDFTTPEARTAGRRLFGDAYDAAVEKSASVEDLFQMRKYGSTRQPFQFNQNQMNQPFQFNQNQLNQPFQFNQNQLNQPFQFNQNQLNPSLGSYGAPKAPTQAKPSIFSRGMKSLGSMGVGAVTGALGTSALLGLGAVLTKGRAPGLSKLVGGAAKDGLGIFNPKTAFNAWKSAPEATRLFNKQMRLMNKAERAGIDSAAFNRLTKAKNLGGAQAKMPEIKQFRQELKQFHDMYGMSPSDSVTKLVGGISGVASAGAGAGVAGLSAAFGGGSKGRTPTPRYYRGMRKYGSTEAPTVGQIRAARNATHTDTTKAQRDAGNYKKGRVKWHGVPLVIENPKDSFRRGTDPSGKKWETRMTTDYGYIQSTMAIDGDAVDVFLGPNLKSELVVAIDQYVGGNPKGEFDETKFILGCDTVDQAKKLYLSNYQKGWKLGPVASCTMWQFKDWLKSGDHKAPFSGQMLKAARQMRLSYICERLQGL